MEYSNIALFLLQLLIGLFLWTIKKTVSEIKQVINKDIQINKLELQKEMSEKNEQTKKELEKRMHGQDNRIIQHDKAITAINTELKIKGI